MSGLNPSSLHGRGTAVYVGCGSSEVYDAWTSDYGSVTGYEMMGCSPAMFANRVSYFFDLHGLCREMNMTTATRTTITTTVLLRPLSLPLLVIIAVIVDVIVQ